jgi:predicted dehydrogenase
MNSFKTLNAAVIGLGVGERHIAGYLSDPRCRVIALSDIDPKKLQDVSKRYPTDITTTNPDEILSNPNIDVVSIASYDNAHCDQILKAIQYNKHVFVEKPLCLTQNEYLKISNALQLKPNLHISSNLI